MTSPAYMNSRMAVRWEKGTSFRMMMGCLAGFCSSRFLKYGLRGKTVVRWDNCIKLAKLPASAQNHLVSLGVLAFGGDGDVTERLLVPKVFEGGHHVSLEVVPAETELLVTLVGRHLEKEKVLLNTNLQKDLEKTNFRFL